MFLPYSLALAEVMVTSSKRTYATCCTSQDCCSQSLAPRQVLWTHACTRDSEHAQARLARPLVGSLLLSPGAHRVLSVPSKSLFPQS